MHFKFPLILIEIGRTNCHTLTLIVPALKETQSENIRHSWAMVTEAGPVDMEVASKEDEMEEDSSSENSQNCSENSFTSIFFTPLS
uniref:Uncharacterized protein n=1 Tax=Ditylenchus dipsaci TaxID=166011 RepID=A0A915DIG8_9BILA